ncbi:hypothetical protein [Kineosporia succinea]|uniref:Uncharacterized protein n=1 Tax=Kineosporia succinea TaxID=84632 RepID=A0ABT9NYX6_9ACTN|nr:hypothetical protein [Kineosporia succinea]MDP9825641.1 hypothetical protein [Kineosporia succinea]
MFLVSVCLLLTVVAVGAVIGMYLRDSRNAHRISDEGSEFLETLETAPPNQKED